MFEEVKNGSAVSLIFGLLLGSSRANAHPDRMEAQSETVQNEFLN